MKRAPLILVAALLAGLTLTDVKRNEGVRPGSKPANLRRHPEAVPSICSQNRR